MWAQQNKRPWPLYCVHGQQENLRIFPAPFSDFNFIIAEELRLVKSYRNPPSGNPDGGSLFYLAAANLNLQAVARADVGELTAISKALEHKLTRVLAAVQALQPHRVAGSVRLAVHEGAVHDLQEGGVVVLPVLELRAEDKAVRHALGRILFALQQVDPHGVTALVRLAAQGHGVQAIHLSIIHI